MIEYVINVVTLWVDVSKELLLNARGDVSLVMASGESVVIILLSFFLESN